MIVGDRYRQVPRRPLNQRRGLGGQVQVGWIGLRRPDVPAGLLPGAPLLRVLVGRRRHEELGRGEISIKKSFIGRCLDCKKFSTPVGLFYFLLLTITIKIAILRLPMLVVVCFLA
jgi:hypothetical protein